MIRNFLYSVIMFKWGNHFKAVISTI